MVLLSEALAVNSPQKRQAGANIKIPTVLAYGLLPISTEAACQEVQITDSFITLQ